MSAPPRRPPSGEQHELTFGEHRAVVVEVGGGVREYARAGRHVLDPYEEHAMCDGAHGTPLVPWPNRLADGRYRFDGVEQQLALTEPPRRNAIHGLLRWCSWRAAEREPHRVVMSCAIHPMPGYPFELDVGVEYALGEDGLTVTIRARNAGEAPCPFGAGQHPYVSAGGTGARLDDCSLELAAGVRILTDDERMLPTGREPVAGTAFDFGSPRPLAGREIDSAFTSLARDADGRARARLSRADGATAELWVDERFPYLEAYTGDGLAPARRRLGLGLEPMTCPP
ncbi:MAG TPA: aldose 1-epimerase family protein, partial [Solirubrobacteraceae bacterium]|nr:aldose 1-epimerase family protein [Solirubrobacteraceae bacterium]